MSKNRGEKRTSIPGPRPFYWQEHCFFSILFLAFLTIRLDTSEGRIYSISQGTKQLLNKLDDTLLLRLYFSSQLPPNFKINEQYIRDLLKEYKRASGGNVRVEFFDPNKSDKIRQQAIQAGIAPVKLDVRERDRREVKECFMGISILFGTETEAIPFIQETQGLEYDISQRIKRLIHPGEVKIGVIQSGNSLSFNDDALKELKVPMSELFTLENVGLEESISKDYKSVWLIGPSEEIPPQEIEKLKEWVEQGGTLGLLIDRHAVDVQQFRPSPLRTGLEDLLKEWGVKFKSGLVVDPRSDRIQVQSTSGFIQWVNLVDYPYFPLTGDLDRKHPATKGIDVLAFPFISPLIVEGRDGMKYTSLAKSSEASWLDAVPTNLSPLQRHPKKQGAEEGPFDLGLIIEGTFAKEEQSGEGDLPVGRVIVFGTSRFVRTDFPPRSQNFSVFMNLMDWSVQDEALLSIRSQGVAYRPLRKMSEGVRAVVKYALILFLPLFSLLLGLFIWRRARLRRSLLPLKYREV